METAKIPETRDQALQRLALESSQRGIKVFTYPRTGEWYATSQSQPGTLHRVTVVSCDCPAFMFHGRCRHHAALLAAIGELPDPDPDGGQTCAKGRTDTARSVDNSDAVSELARLENLNRACELKSTADFRRLHAARELVSSFAAPVQAVA